jgi:hypothetical protein
MGNWFASHTLMNRGVNDILAQGEILTPEFIPVM